MKRACLVDGAHYSASLPMRERELKLAFAYRCSRAVASLPMRERELKHKVYYSRQTRAPVAPHAGARIETAQSFGLGAGLVLKPDCTCHPVMAVAPHAGARIETKSRPRASRFRWVAPHAGARIETAVSRPGGEGVLSLPMRERELKLYCASPYIVLATSLPMRERELKRFVSLPASASCSRSPCGSAN